MEKRKRVHKNFNYRQRKKCINTSKRSIKKSQRGVLSDTISEFLINQKECAAHRRTEKITIHCIRQIKTKYR